MCVENPTTEGIENLPGCGTYYKALTRDDTGPYYNFKYPVGKTISIPEKTQSGVVAGGHFYRNRKDADAELKIGNVHLAQVAQFRIYRKHISHIGESFDFDWDSSAGSRVPVVLANKARRIS